MYPLSLFHAMNAVALKVLLTIRKDGTKAYVTLQEANSLAVLDLTGAAPVEQGLADHIARFRASIAGLKMSLPHTDEEIADILIECTRRQGLRDDGVCHAVAELVGVSGQDSFGAVDHVGSLSSWV